MEGYTPVPIEHFGGLITAWPPEMLDASLLAEAVNVKFTEAEVQTREGLALAFATPSGKAVAGLANYLHLDGTEQPLVLDAGGTVYAETPAGSGTLMSAPTALGVSIPAGASLQAASAFGRIYLAFGNGQKGTGTPSSYDGTEVDPVTIAAPPGGATAADSAAAGNIAAGTRWGVVMYRTREGSLTAPGAPFSWTAAGGKQAMISGLPVSASGQVVARVVAFTVAGGSEAGPYFWIGTPQTVNGVSETITEANDDSTTSITVNFDDNFLASSNDATEQFRAMVLPNLAGVFFSALTQRLLWWGDPAQPNAVYCSQPSDGGFYLGDTGFFQVAEGSGQRVTAVWEQRNQIYVALSDSLYLVTPNDGDPATWAVQQVSPGIGVAGPRAVAVGAGYSIFVHRTGCFQFDGGTPAWVSDELLGAAPTAPGMWERINWAYDDLIWVDIDHEAKCVRIGVPLDGATQCSHILKVSYLDGWEKSIRFSPFTARYHYFPGRRWSLDVVAASQGLRVKRPLAVDATPADRRLGQAQVLLASSLPNGAVYYISPNAEDDAGLPFSFALRTGACSASELLRQNRQGMEQVGLVQLRASGRGLVSLQAVPDAADPATVAGLPLALPSENAGDLSTLPLTQGEAVGIRLSGAGATLRLRAMYAFCRPSWMLRPGGK